MGKPIQTIIVIILIIVFSLGFYILGLYTGQKHGDKATIQTVEQGQTIVDYYRPLPFIQHQEVFSIKGDIQKITSNAIHIRQIPDSFTPLILQDAPNIVVNIDEQTEIYYKPNPDPEQLFKKLNNENPSSETDNTQKLSLNSLRVSDIVIIRSAENIKDKNQFTATSIRLVK